MDWLIDLAKSAERRVNKFGAQYFTFAFFVVINYPIALFYGLNTELDCNYAYFTMRLLSTLFCIPLLFVKKWPTSFKQYLPIYWYFTIILAGSLMGVYMLLDSAFSLGWVINFNIGVMMMILLVDWVMFIILEVIGIILGIGLYILVYKHLPSIPNNDISTLFFYMFFWIAVTGAVFSRNKEVFNQLLLRVKEKLNFDLEQTVIDRTQELNKALSVKTDFLNNISHEIRAPVAGFSMAADNLLMHWPSLNESQKFNMVKVIAGSAERIKNLSMHLVDATKLQDGMNILDLKRINLSHFINDFIDEASALYTKEKNIKIKFKSEQDFYIKADYEAISQVLRNLVTNAIKFSPADSTISIKLRLDENNVKVTVSDQGVGIPPGELDQIFTPFYQSSRTKNGAGGVGLGLNISRQIVEIHGGEIWAENNAKQGASFIFTLKRLEDEVNPASTADKRTILIIDDDEAIHASLALGLTALGHKIISAMDAEEGLVTLKKYHDEIDVVFLDIMMPGMDGIQALKIIKSKWPELRIVMHSGCASLEDLEKTKQLGAYSFIKKPYKIAELIERLGD